MFYVPDETEKCGFYACSECGSRFLDLRIAPALVCPYCGEEPDMEVGPNDETPVISESAKLIQVIEGEDVEKYDTLLSLAITGGDEGWQLYSVSRWSREDALKLKEFLELEFDKNERRDVYWDDIPMFLHADAFRLGIRVMNKEDILEIDSLEELQEIDSSYLNIKGE